MAALPRDAAPVYPAELTPLLDLVPNEGDHFVVMRDPAAVLRLFDELFGVVGPSVLAKEGATQEVLDAKAGLEAVGKLRDALIAAKVDLDKGVVFLEESDTFLYATASDDPSAINAALRAVAVDDIEFPPCVEVAAMPGFAACGPDDAVAKALKPGKHGAAFRAEFEAALTGFDLEHGNLLFRVGGPGGSVLGAVATPPGRVHVVVGLSAVAKELGKYLVAKKPAGLGMVAPGASFLWMQLSMDAFADAIAQSPIPIANVTDSLTGELLVGGVEGSVVAGFAGVSDPFPASGLVSLAGLQSDAIAEQLPPGSTVAVKPVELSSGSTPALQVEVAMDEANAALADSLGVSPKAFGFSAGSYAGVLVGGDAPAVKAVAEYEPGTALPSGLPGNLAHALASGDVAFAFYAPVDAMQEASIRASLGSALAAASTSEGVDTQIVDIVYDLLSPFSSLSMWFSHPNDHRVLHVSIESFGDGVTAEGKAALDTLAKVVGGGDAAKEYAALASAYPSSPRASRYALRAGTKAEGGGRVAMSSATMFGIVAGITVPAFTKYVERARAASEELSAAKQAAIEAAEEAR